MKIFIVEGSTGEYSDHDEWPVAAYKDEELAKEHVRLADEEYRVWLGGRDPYSLGYLERQEVVNSYDPEMRMDYTGLSYSYYTVELRDALPEGG